MGIGIPDKKLFKIYTACQNGIFEKNICGENGNLICTMGIPITCMQLWCGKFPILKLNYTLSGTFLQVTG